MTVNLQVLNCICFRYGSWSLMSA